MDRLRKHGKSTGHRIWAWIGSFALAVSLGCMNEEPPLQLVGTWMATSPRHQGRFLEISKEHLVFGSDENHSTYFTISGVESRELEGETLYTIAYHGVGGDGRTLVLRVSERQPEAIELENHSGAWIRKGLATPRRKESI